MQFVGCVPYHVACKSVKLKKLPLSAGGNCELSCLGTLLGSAFAVCIVQCSLVHQFEHSGKVRQAWFKFAFENLYSSLLSGPASL